MTIFAKGNSIRDIVPKFWVIRPIFNMMRLQKAAAFAAFLARKIRSLKNVFMPLFVFIASYGNRSIFFISLVGGMVYAALKMFSTFPFVRIRPVSYTFHSNNSRTWIVPRTANKFPDFIRSFFRFISTGFRTIRCLAARATPKFFATFRAFINDRRMETFPRAINPLAFFVHARSDFELFSTTLANSSNSFSRISAPAFITAFQRTALTATMSKVRRFGFKSIAAIFANNFDGCVQYSLLTSI